MFGDRLKLARKKAGLSLDALAAAMNGAVTKQAISKYERGEMMPGSRVLTQLSRTLDVSVEFLMSSDVVALEGIDFRSKSTTSAKDRAQVEATVMEHAERYLAIESILGDEAGAWHDQAAASLGSEEDCERLAASIREQWNLGLDPIPNLTGLLEDRGLKVLLLPLPEKVSGLTCYVRRQSSDERFPVIVANARMNLERRRLTLSHELFHRLAGVGDGSDLKEESAMNRCAGAFLMPAQSIVSELGARRERVSYEEIRQTKHRFGVSAAALLVRLRQIGVLSEQSVAYAFRTYANRWRKFEPDPICEPDGGLEQPERFRRLCFRAFSEEHISRAKVMELLKLPYNEIAVAMKGPSLDADHC